MKSKLYLQLQFIDRIGIVADVTAVLVDYDHNIVTMTVQIKGKYAFVYLETEHDRSQVDKYSFFARLNNISGCRNTKVISTLPHATKDRG